MTGTTLRPFNVRLSDSHLAKARNIGGDAGASAGIRKALDQHSDAEPICWQLVNDHPSGTIWEAKANGYTLEYGHTDYTGNSWRLYVDGDGMAIKHGDHLESLKAACEAAVEAAYRECCK